MALTINSNHASSIALRSLQQSQNALDRALSRLASGQNAPSARYDAAGVAVSSRIRAELVSLQKYQLNAQQGISVLQAAEGTYQRTNDILVRMRALASQAQGSNLSATERGMLDTEYQQLKTEITRLAQSSTFAATRLFEVNDIGFGTYNTATSAGTVNTVVADYNGDGINDILTATSAGTVSLSLGLGDGTFGTATSVATGLVNPSALVLADVNGDGVNDFVVQTTIGTYLYRNDGTGTFTQSGSLGGAASYANLTVIDIDGDGISDFVTGQNASYYIFRNTNGGGNISASAGSVGFTLTGILTGDMNNDGISDLVFTNGTQMQIALGSGTGSFANNSVVTHFPASAYLRGTLADMNDDGFLDIIFGSASANVFVVLNTGSNFAGGATAINMGGADNSGVYAGDLNGDGIIDLASYASGVANSQFNFKQGTGTLTFGTTQTVSTGAAMAQNYGLVFADLNRDGRLDAVVRRSGGLASILNQTNMGLEGTFRVSSNGAAVDNVGFRAGSIRLNSLDNQLEFSMINSKGTAKRAELSIKRAMETLSLFRTNVGSAMNRLEKVTENIATMIENQEGARSAIADLDVAQEMSAFTAQKLVQQAGISMLSQANNAMRNIAKLLESGA